MAHLQGKIFVISAPSGGGKTTIAKEIIKKKGSALQLSKVITYTTRPQRPNEQDGVDYFFVSPKDFLLKKNQNFFLETTMYDNHWYGSPRSILTEVNEGKSFIFVLDRPGAKSIYKLIPDAILIWIDVPSIDVLADRLNKRHSESDASLERRIALAKQEIEEEKKHPFFTYHIINDTLNKALQDVENIITEQVGVLPTF